MTGGGGWSTVAAVLLVAGCAAFDAGPDARYRQTLAAAFDSRVCTETKVAAVFRAYDDWSVTLPAERREEAAAVLLGQAQAFRAAGCDEAARASLERVLSRFSTETLARYRFEALRGLQTLPPPYPLSGSPVRGT